MTEETAPGLLEWANEVGIHRNVSAKLSNLQPDQLKRVSRVAFPTLVSAGLSHDEALEVRNKLSESVRDIRRRGESIAHEGELLIKRKVLWFERWEKSYFQLDAHANILMYAKTKSQLASGKKKRELAIKDICRITYVDADPSAEDHVHRTGSHLGFREVVLKNNEAGQRESVTVKLGNKLKTLGDATTRRFEIHVRHGRSTSDVKVLLCEADSSDDAQEWVDRLREKVYVIAKMYQVGPNNVFPEQQRLGYAPTFGVCFTGGGARSYAATLGQLRALHRMGILDKVQYISSVSAGAWATGIYTYYRKGAANDEELLGLDYFRNPLEDVSKLTINKLMSKSCPMANPPTVNVFSHLSSLFWKSNPHELWENMVGRVYLEPFGLSGDDVAFTLPSLVDEILELNPHLASAKFNIARPNRPFWIANATIIGPEWAQAGESLAPIQFTGMYTGSPACYKIKYQPKRGFTSKKKSREVWVGGGMLDSYAFGSPTPEHGIGHEYDTSATTSWAPVALKHAWGHMKDELARVEGDLRDMLDRGSNARRSVGSAGGRLIQVERPMKLFSLQHALGISSDGPGVKFENTPIVGNRYNPQQVMWSPEEVKRHSRRSKRHQDAQKFDLADGGSLDNTGLLPMIQRKVENCIVFVNSRLSIPLTDEEEDLDGQNLGHDTDVHAQAEDHDDETAEKGVDYKELPNVDLLALFGVDIDEAWDEYGQFNRNKVFKKHRIRGLLKRFRAKAARGEPLVVQGRYKVLKNNWWGIEGGWCVNVMWVYLHSSSVFADQLPPQVQQEIKLQHNGAFGRFPNYKTLNENADHHQLIDTCLELEQVNLLSCFTDWVVTKHQAQIEAFSQGAAGGREHPPKERAHSRHSGQHRKTSSGLVEMFQRSKDAVRQGITKHTQKRRQTATGTAGDRARGGSETAVKHGHLSEDVRSRVNSTGHMPISAKDIIRRMSSRSSNSSSESDSGV